MGNADQPRVPAGSPQGGEWTSTSTSVTLPKSLNTRAEVARFDAQVAKATEKLSVAEKDALDAYSGSAFVNINSTLRGAPISPLQQKIPSEQIDKFTRDIDSAIQKTALAEDTVLWRGGAFPTADLQKGSVVSDRGFISCSLEEGIAMSFNRQENMKTWQISVPKGTKCALMYNYGDSNEIYASAEAEVILPRGSQFRVTGITSEKVYAELIK
jgi:hypothetical protein